MFAASSTKASPVDLWNDVKIPEIDYYEKEAEPDSNGWITSGVDQLGWKSPLGDWNETSGSDGMIMWSENIANRYKTAFETLEPFQFSYVTLGDILLNDGSTNRTLDNITCSVKNSYVEVGVLCVANPTCRAAEIRRLQLPQFPLAFTFMDFGNGSILSNLMSGLMTSIGGNNGDSIPSVLDSRSRDEYNYTSPSNYNWTWDCSSKSKAWSSQGNKYEHIEVMAAHKPWAITLAIASLVLIALSLVPPLVRHFLTKGPEIAINVSSLATRNDTHVPIPAGGSFLPAADRFRLLKDLSIRFVDANGRSDVGNLVIAAQGVEKAEYSRVRKGRLYE
ncbi:hypothetical protein AG0111_0g3665 [Alternaria gaisen]|uniref:Uncharacterized protein n=1 Tax=Alternaria gaisen TaxID=167740 RepID=A0ACB6FTY9_9PLEO|nr:hypothetical protein AG0111_0g3665 [Alternaria gaisen]